MKYAFSNEQMRRADAATIAAGTPSAELMERAGSALARAVAKAMEQKGVSDALFVCGGGNNGGDGFVAGPHSFEAGEDVSVLCLAKSSPPTAPPCAKNTAGKCSGASRAADTASSSTACSERASPAPWRARRRRSSTLSTAAAHMLSPAIFRAAFGVRHCARGVRARRRNALDGAAQTRAHHGGRVDCAGKVSVADIGIYAEERGAEVWEAADVKKLFPKRLSNTHKGSYGAACILAGGAYSGAAFLAAGACLKSGAGYTKLCVTEPLFSGAVGKLPAVILRKFTAIDGDILASDCIAAGMGAGVSEQLYVHLAQLLEAYTGTLVLDADALNTLAAYGTEVLDKKACKVILTPHPKEFARLVGKPCAEVLADAVGRQRSVCRAARRHSHSEK